MRIPLKDREANDDLRAITVRQPWAHAIIHLGKDVENRSRYTYYRDRILIHAGKHVDREGAESLGLDPDALVHGAIIGSVEIVDCIEIAPGVEPSASKIVDWRQDEASDAEFDAAHPGLNHPIDRIAAAATDAHDDNARGAFEAGVSVHCQHCSPRILLMRSRDPQVELFAASVPCVITPARRLSHGVLRSAREGNF